MNGLSGEGPEGSLEHRRRKPNGPTGLLLALSALLLAPGLVLPAITVERLWFGTDYSILAAVAALAREGNWFLALIIGAFSVAFPVAKLVLAGWAWMSRRTAGRMVAAMGAVSKYSMLDVFIVALTVLVLDGRLLTSASAGPGIFCFAASVLLSTWALARLGHGER